MSFQVYKDKFGNSPSEPERQKELVHSVLADIERWKAASGPASKSYVRPRKNTRLTMKGDKYSVSRKSGIPSPVPQRRALSSLQHNASSSRMSREDNDLLRKGYEFNYDWSSPNERDWGSPSKRNPVSVAAYPDTPETPRMDVAAFLAKSSNDIQRDEPSISPDDARSKKALWTQLQDEVDADEDLMVKGLVEKWLTAAAAVESKATLRHGSTPALSHHEEMGKDDGVCIRVTKDWGSPSKREPVHAEKDWGSPSKRSAPAVVDQGGEYDDFKEEQEPEEEECTMRPDTEEVEDMSDLVAECTVSVQQGISVTTKTQETDRSVASVLVWRVLGLAGWAFLGTLPLLCVAVTVLWPNEAHGAAKYMHASLSDMCAPLGHALSTTLVLGTQRASEVVAWTSGTMAALDALGPMLRVRAVLSAVASWGRPRLTQAIAAGEQHFHHAVQFASSTLGIEIEVEVEEATWPWNMSPAVTTAGVVGLLVLVAAGLEFAEWPGKKPLPRWV